MKLKAPMIKKLAQGILSALQDKKLIKILSSSEKTLAKIESVIAADVKIEQEIEQQARLMMDKYRAQVEKGEIDYQKMYGMIRKQLIKERKFTP